MGITVRPALQALKRAQPAPDLSHPAMAVNLSACIQCTRCVRACREAQVNDVIGYAGRGSHARIVFDLDPGDGVTMAQLCEVARAVRELVAGMDLEAYPVTSGSKGLHLYVPLASPVSSRGASAVAKRVAQQLESSRGGLVTATMTRSLRAGKVFLDWSQNSAAKTTVAPYSLRGRDEPTVAAPRTFASSPPRRVRPRPAPDERSTLDVDDQPVRRLHTEDVEAALSVQADIDH